MTVLLPNKEEGRVHGEGHVDKENSGSCLFPSVLASCLFLEARSDISIMFIFTKYEQQNVATSDCHGLVI